MSYKWKNGKLVKEEDEEEKLLNSLLERRQRLEDATEEDRGGIMGLWDDVTEYARVPDLGDVLDLVSRPSYAVQEAIASTLDPDKRSGVGGSALDALVGAGRGLWGTKKTSAIETLADAGREGLPYTALGLASDIFMDPLTYVGGAPLRAVGSAQKAAKGAKALGETTEQVIRLGDEVRKFNPEDITKSALRLQNERVNKGLLPLRGPELREEAVSRIMKTKEDDALRRLNEDFMKPYGLANRSKTPMMHARKRVEDVEKGLKRFNQKPLTERKRKALLDRFAREEAFSIAKAAQKAAESTVDAKRAGLRIRFGPKSTEIRADNPLVSKIVDNPKLRNTASRVANSEMVQSLNKKFRTEGTYGKVFNETRKFKNAQGVASYDELVGAKIAQAGGLSINDVIRGLTEKEAKDFYRAYELGDLQQLPEVFKSGLKRDDVAKLVKYHMDDFFDTEFDAGLIPYKRDEAGNLILDEAGRPVPAVEKVDNYLYHRAIKNPSEFDKLKKKQYVRAVGKDIHEPGVERVFETAADAAKHGIEIDTDIRTALLNRTAKHTQGLARASFVDDAISNFGIKLDDAKTIKQMKADGHDLVRLKSVLADAKKGAALEYIPENIFVERHVADSLKGLETVANNPGPFLRFADQVLKRWKPAVTVYNPGHHVRNFTSDIMLGYLDGVKNPKLYAQAMDIAFNKNLKGTLKIGKGRLRKDQVVKLFHESGASPNFVKTEVGENVLGGKISRGVRDVAEKREEVARMAHFIHALKEEAANVSHKGVVSQEIIDKAATAAQRVKKWHLDYGDLTEFERAYMKRVIPFYTWMRKSTPLMVEAMALRPGKVANIDKSFQALFQQIGVDPGEALPTDQIPDWIREGIYGQVGFSGQNPLFLQPDVPFAEPFKWTDEGLPGALQQGLSSLNPLLKGPIELGMGRSTFTGAPIDQGVGRYAASTIPQSRIIQGLLSGKEGTATKVANWAGGAGLREVSPASQRGEIRRQIDMLEAKLAEQNRPYPYKSQTDAPRQQFVWENGKLVKKGRNGS